MKKLLMLIVTAAAMTITMAPSASAAVEVRNGNGDLCEVEAECLIESGPYADISILSGDGNSQWTTGPCEAEWTIRVHGDGYLLLENASFWGYETYNCRETIYNQNMFGFCGGADVAQGQILEPGDSRYVGPGHQHVMGMPDWINEHYSAVIDVCWNSVYDSWGSGLYGTILFDVKDYTFPEEWGEPDPLEWTAVPNHKTFDVPSSSPTYVKDATLTVEDGYLPQGGLRVTPVED